MKTTGDQQLVRRINRSVVLRLLRAHPGLSRARLAEESGSPWREVLPRRLSGVLLSDDGRPTHPL